jgi:hypothetical protein
MAAPSSARPDWWPMTPPAAAPSNAPVAAPRWVFGPAGAAQLESDMAATTLVSVKMRDFIEVLGCQTNRRIILPIKDYSAATGSGFSKKNAIKSENLARWVL